MKNILQKANKWLSNDFDKDTIEKVQSLIKSNSSELTESFYKDLEFGTGGMRGIMGVGTNRINKYTLGMATQGLANYINSQFPDTQNSVAIAYDVRKNSDVFAKICANILSANDIKVYLFEEFRPTPELSFAVRNLGCTAGIVITASHNPPEYNGYKVYWNDGAQIVPPHDAKIIENVRNIEIKNIKFKGNDSLIEYLSSDMDSKFIDACCENGTFSKETKNNIKIVYTSLHGTGIKLMPEALKRAGFTNVLLEESQSIPDGNFPTVESPNPEEPKALKMAIDLANKHNADIVIGTDPDADRLGIAVRNLDGEMTLLNGNQTNTLMIDYLLKNNKKQNKLDGNQFVGSTIVSSDIFFELADNYGIQCKASLTGFKWIAKMISDNKHLKFIGGGEESFGFMVGDFVRDKDSVTSTILACEIASCAKKNNSSVYEELIKIYTENSLYREHLISIVKKGMDGSEKIKQMMIDFRANPPKTINNSEVVKITDYQNSTELNVSTKATKTIDLEKSNVLIYYTKDGSKIAIRPSGTEPKIKFYFSVKSNLDKESDFVSEYTKLDLKIKAIIKDMNL